MMFKRRIVYIVQFVKWYFQYFICKLCGNYNKNVIRMTDDSFINPLILVPHSDDEWIGPYSILKHAGRATTCVYFNLFGNDYSDANKTLRNAEIIKSSQYWGFILQNNYNYDFVSLSNQLRNHDVVYAPSPYDWHPEHRKVFQALYYAMKLLPESEVEKKKIYYYSVSVPHRLCETVHYVSLTKNDLNEKWDNFKKIYSSQLFMPSLRYKLNLRLVPKECGYAAQFYIKVDIDRMKCDYNKSIDKSFVSNIAKLIYSINNIVKIRKDSSRFD